MSTAAGGDRRLLEAMVARRVAGEPLAWVTGSLRFAGADVAVDPGVYVPREQTALLVDAAAEVLAASGVAVDLCTGSGAVAVALARRRRAARVVATDVDPVACACARRNGVEVYQGDLDAGLPLRFRRGTDVVTAVAPYVPSDYIDFLPRDFRDHEPRRALDGGADGTRVLVAVVEAATRLLRAGGCLVVEVGATQDRALSPVLADCGFAPADALFDREGDLRALRALLR